jgi:hypothetical protein
MQTITTTNTASRYGARNGDASSGENLIIAPAVAGS